MEPYMTYRSIVALRIIAPFILYILLSLAYAMISLAFKVPFGAKYVVYMIYFGTHVPDVICVGSIMPRDSLCSGPTIFY